MFLQTKGRFGQARRESVAHGRAGDDSILTLCDQLLPRHACQAKVAWAEHGALRTNRRCVAGSSFVPEEEGFTVMEFVETLETFISFIICNTNDERYESFHI